MSRKGTTTVDIQYVADTKSAGSKRLDATNSASETTTSTTPASSKTPGVPSEPLEVSDEPNNTAEEISYPTGITLWITIASLVLTVIFVGLDMTIVAVTIPSLTNQFKKVDDIGWYSAAFTLFNSSFTFMFSKAYTVFDVKRVYLVAIALFELGSLLCTVAPTSGTFILGRAVAGVGGAGLFNGAMTILTYTFPMQKRPLWNGIFAAVQTVSMVAAPLIGGALIDAFTWRACFGINLPMIALAFGVIAYYFKNPITNPDIKLPFKQKLRRMDLLGSALFVPSMVCLLIGLQWGGTRYGWANARIITLLVVFAILLGLFSYLQYRKQDAATLPPRIIKQRSVIAAAFYSAFCSGILAVTEYYIAIYFQGVKGFTATKSGALGLPMIIGLPIGALSAGILTSTLGYYHPFMLATSILAPIATGLLTTLDLDDKPIKVLSLLGFLGVAVGLGIQGPVSAVQAVLAPKDMPIGIAINGFGGGVGTALFLVIASALFQNRLDREIASRLPGLDFGPSGVKLNGSFIGNGNGTRTGIGLGGSGLADLRRYLGDDKMKDVLLGYDSAVVQTFYIPVACATLSIIACFGVEWKSVKQKKA